MEAHIALLLLLALVVVDADGCEKTSLILSETFPADGRVLRQEAEENRAKLCETEMADIVYEIERMLGTMVAKGESESLLVFYRHDYPHVTDERMQNLYSELRKRYLFPIPVETPLLGTYPGFRFRISLTPPESVAES
jgi:hypothetical protein